MIRKSKVELNALKEEVKPLNKKLAELNEEELLQVTGGDVTSANVVGYNLSDNTASINPLGCMFEAPVIIKA